MFWTERRESMANLEYLSHSSLEDVRSCSYKYKLRKIDRVAQRPSWSLIGGNAVHSVTEAIDKRDFGIPVEPVELDFMAVFSGLTELAMEAEDKLSTAHFYASGRKSKEWPDKENEKWWLQNGPPMVQRWIDFKRVTNWEIWITPQGDPAIELALHAEYGGVPVKGYLDRVMELPNGDLAVLDLKTGANEPKSDGQLGQYADMVAKLLGEEYRPKWGTYWMGRTGSLTPPVDLAPLARGLDRDYGVAKTIIEQDLFLTSPSMLCGSCSVNQSCPSFSPGIVSQMGPTT
jgi:putative RecB family exonuclease